METNQNNANINPTQPEEKKEQKTVPYTDKEKDYASYLQIRLQLARDARNQNHDEFDGMSYMQYYENNLKGANSYIAPKKNREDTTFVTGTTRQALFALIAKIAMLNLEPEIKAFDKNDHNDIHTGQAIEDVVIKAGEIDHDEEKKLLRQYEMFSQGTVFAEEIWTEEFVSNKKLNSKKWEGQVKDVKWSEKLAKVFEGCRRNMIPGPNMYLGSITEFDMEQQPFIFSIDYVPYDEAKALYGDWERWKYVTRTVQPFSGDQPSSIYFNNWRLNSTRQDIVEVIKYQDKWSNEYMIVLNGVMMMPIGFPLPWKYGEYNIVKQIFEILTPYFAYGGSLVKRLKTAQGLEDEFWRLAILKTQQSFKPPTGNMTGKVLSSRVFMPGVLTMGVNAAGLTPLVDAKGVSQSELAVLKMLKDNMHDNSLPEISQGQNPEGSPTATEIMQLQNQAKILIGLAVFSASLLEKKLAILRVYNVLENWFEPVDTQANEARDGIKNKYRTASVKASIPGAGKGRRLVKPTDDMPKQELFPGKDEVYDEEEKLSKSENQPVRITYLNPKELKSVKYSWFVEVNPREKESSELSKVLFGNMIAGLESIGQLGQTAPMVNLDFVEERFAEVWNLPADKAFTKQANAAMGGGMPPMPGAVPGAPAAAGGMPPQQMTAGAKAPLNAGRPSINTLMNGK